MITKKEIKKEVDKLPDSLVNTAYLLLKSINPSKKEDKKWTMRDFDGKLDHTDIRGMAYE